jgi:steroid 5-alpha reductase family enzyme
MFDDIAAGFGLNLAATALVLLGCVLALWLLSIRLRDMSIIDIFWGPGFGVVAIVTFLLSAGAGVGARRLLVTVLTVAWSARLGIYLWLRNHGKGEDPRYTAAFRDRIKDNLHWHTLNKVFLLQGTLIWLISMTVQLAQYLTRPASLGRAWYASVDCRFPVRGGIRRATRTIQGRSRQPRPHHGPGPVALHAPSKLFR